MILTAQIKSDEIYFDLSNLFDNIKKYIEDERYIKFENKYVIGITDKNFNKKISFLLREKFHRNKLGDIFILSSTFDFKYKKKKKNL